MRLQENSHGKSQRTVDRNGNAFVNSVAVSAYKCGDLSELVELEVLGTNIPSLKIDDLKVDVVSFGYCADSSRAGIALKLSAFRTVRGESMQHILHTGKV